MTVYSTFEETPMATNYADFQHTLFALFRLDTRLNWHYWEMWNNMDPTERNWHEFLYNIAMENV